LDLGPGWQDGDEWMIMTIGSKNKINPLREVFILPLVLYLHVLHSQRGLGGAHAPGGREGGRGAGGEQGSLDGPTQRFSIVQTVVHAPPRGSLKDCRGGTLKM